MLTATDLGMKEMLEFGAKIGSLMAPGLEGDEAYASSVMAGIQKVSTGHIFNEAEAAKLAEDIPLGTAVGVALIEHRWAIPLRAAIARADGEILSEEWLSPEHLMELGRIAGAGEQPGLGGGKARPRAQRELAARTIRHAGCGCRRQAGLSRTDTTYATTTATITSGMTFRPSA